MKRRYEMMIVLTTAVWMQLAQAQDASTETKASSPTAAPAAAQPAKAPPPAPSEIKLLVLQKGKGIPIRRAEVKIGKTVLVTGHDGIVKFPMPPKGPGVISVSRKGFETATIEFGELTEPGEYQVYLYPGVGGENTVIIRGQRRNTVSRKTVSIDEAAKVAPGGDPAQVVKLLPGVQSRGMQAEVVVRGSGPRDSKYFIDDLEVPFVFHAFGNLSIIPVPTMESVDFESGGFGPEYGDATGGVITLHTKSRIPERPMTQFVINLPFYSGVYHERPLSENQAVSVSLRRSYIDIIIQKVLENQNVNGTGRGSMSVAPYFADGHAQYFQKTESGHNKISLLSAYDGVKASAPLDASTNEDGRADFKMYTGFFNLGFERLHHFDKDWSATTTPQVYYFRTSADLLGNSLEDTTTRIRVPTEFNRKLSSNEDLYFGLDPSYTIASSDAYMIQFRPGDPTFDPEDATKVRTIRRDKNVSLATWAAIDQAFGSLTVTPGVRGYYNDQIHRASADPRLRIKYVLNKENTLKSAVGQYSESPSPRQAAKDTGNPHLGFERSNHYVLGLETHWGDEWTTEVQAFYKTAKRVIESDPDTNYNNDGSFKSSGGELFIRKNLTGRLFGWLSYTYSKTLERKKDSDPYRNSRYDQTHVVNLVGNYKITGTWDAGGRFNYHTGDTYTVVDHAVYNPNIDKYQRRTDEDANFSGRLPDFNALTVYLGHDFLFDTWKINARAGVESFWFKPIVMGMSYNYDYTKAEERTSAISSVPFIELRGEI